MYEDLDSIDLNPNWLFRDQCIGIIFKLKINNYINKKGHIIYSYNFIPMKRLSCKGCMRCLIDIDTLKHLSKSEIPIFEDGDDNDLYALNEDELGYKLENIEEGRKK